MDFPLLFDVVSKVHRSEGKILLFVYVEHSKIKLDNLRNFFMLIYSFLSNKAPLKKSFVLILKNKIVQCILRALVVGT